MLRPLKRGQGWSERATLFFSDRYSKRGLGWDWQYNVGVLLLFGVLMGAWCGFVYHLALFVMVGVVELLGMTTNEIVIAIQAAQTDTVGALVFMAGVLCAAIVAIIFARI